MAHVIDEYARAVVAGRIRAGRYHHLACVRHLRDRDREGTRRFPYELDLARADRFYRFAEQLRHYKGEWAGQFIRLEPWQKFHLGSVFGWIHPRTGLRRIRTSYNEIPRKNGKSLTAAIVALYVTFFDHEPGAEGYCIATKRDQSKIVWGDCRKLVTSSGLRSRITPLVGNLHRESTASKLEPLGADHDSTDGLNPNLIIADELHAYKTRDLMDVMETATGARRQPLFYQITTAGNDVISPGGDQHDYATKILERVFEDETFFAFIAHADPTDDWTLERTWRKANPNYRVSVKPEDLRALARKAVNMPAAAAAFQQKRLNWWVNSSAPWLSLDGWRAGRSAWTLEAMRGAACYIGIDLSSKIDLTAVSVLFPPTADRLAWRLYAICLTPVETLEKRARRDRAPYDQWVDRGFLRTNPGNRIDQGAVRAIVNSLVAQFDVQAIGVDPWNAGNLVSDLADDGVQVIEVPQTTAQLSAAAKEVEADVLAGLWDDGGNDLLLWCASNVVVVTDGKDNIFPTKKRSRGRIDPIVAAIIARALHLRQIGTVAAEDPDLVVA